MEEEVAEEGEGEEGEGEEGGVDGVEAELVPLEQDQGEATTTTTMAGGKNLFLLLLVLPPQILGVSSPAYAKGARIDSNYKNQVMLKDLKLK